MQVDEEEQEGDWMAVLSIFCVFIGVFFKVHWSWCTSFNVKVGLIPLTLYVHQNKLAAWAAVLCCLRSVSLCLLHEHCMDTVQSRLWWYERFPFFILPIGKFKLLYRWLPWPAPPRIHTSQTCHHQIAQMKTSDSDFKQIFLLLGSVKMLRIPSARITNVANIHENSRIENDDKNE